MIIKKKHITGILLTILSYKPNDKGEMEEFSGLLLEKIGLGLKRRLQKIRRELLKHQETLIEERKDIDKLEGEAKEKELIELMEEEIKLDSEPVFISEIEKIETTFNYDFELIELISA